MKEIKEEKYYIVRGRDSGVFFGKIKERKEREATLTDVRRLWYWDGVSSISQLAKDGTVNPSNCKFTVTVDEIILTDVIEMDLCSKKAIKSIKEVTEWKQ